MFSYSYARQRANAINHCAAKIDRTKMTNKALFLITALLMVHPAKSFLAPSHQIKSITTQLSSSMPHLYRDEPNPLDSDYIKKEEHDPKHSSFHVERGLDTIDNASDPAHSVHHHLIDVDQKKLGDLGLKAQNAWKPVNVHEVEVDAVSVTAILFIILAAVLFGSGFINS